MMRTLIIVAILIMFLSCTQKSDYKSNSKDNQNSSERLVSDNLKKSGSDEKTSKSIDIKNKNENLLDGTWGLDENANANFGIYGDSIYYVDPDLWYKISYSSDTLRIYKGNGKIEKILILRVDQDSLILNYLNANEIIGYKRRKE